MLELPGTIRISEATCSNEPDYVSVVVDDEDAGARVLEIRLTHEQFGKLLAASRHMDCTILLNDSGHVGMQREHKTELVPRAPGFDPSDDECRAVLAPFEEDGWQGSVSDLRNHHRWRGPEESEVHFDRWVPKKGGDGDA